MGLGGFLGAAGLLLISYWALTDRCYGSYLSLYVFMPGLFLSAIPFALVCGGLGLRRLGSLGALIAYLPLLALLGLIGSLS